MKESDHLPPSTHHSMKKSHSKETAEQPGLNMVSSSQEIQPDQRMPDQKAPSNLDELVQKVPVPVLPQKTSDLQVPPTDNELFIPVHDFIWLSDAEIVIINHPAFLRLGNIFQLGQAYLAYRGATHKRLEHALGATHVAQMIITAVEFNHRKHRAYPPRDGDDSLREPLSAREIVFIRLAAILHDIGHLPAGHTLEDELKLLPQHDKLARLNLVLDREQWFGIPSASLRSVIDEQYSHFVEGCECEASELATQIIAKDYDPKCKVPTGFRLEVCRDIVGNTICADFLDYIYRDWWHLGKPRDFDRRIFQYMEIRWDVRKKQDEFVISLGEVTRLRTDAITAIVSLLEYRYQLAEVVLFHRTKCKGAAMLERALMELSPLDDSAEKREIWSRRMEEALLDHSDWSALLHIQKMAANVPAAKRPIEALLHRKLYREASATYARDITPPGHIDTLKHTYSEGPESVQNRLTAARQLEADFKLPAGCVAIYCPHAGMNAKLPDVSIHLDGSVATYRKWNATYNNMLDGGHITAQLNRFSHLWRVQVVVEQGIWDSWSATLRDLFQRAVKTFVLNMRDARSLPINMITEELAKTLAQTPGSPYVGETVVAAAQWQVQEDAKYPLGAPAIRTCFPAASK